ncbi:MAG: glycosyltransferase, partial [Chloroflexota bacterium]
MGKAELPEEAYLKTLMAQYPGRIRWESLSPEEMPKAYQQADITIIPTVHSEGTSLSCLEALASGNAVIASNVGGLPNLIIHEHNGLLIEPRSDALMQALTRLIEDQGLREKLCARGRDVAVTFSLTRWQSQWQEVLTQYLDGTTTEDIKNLQTAVFPLAPGITWDGIKQRPHHLALQLAKAGVETFWQNPSGRQPSPHPLLHITGPYDEFCGQRPIVIVYYPYSYEELSLYQQPFVIYDILDDISIHQVSDHIADIQKGRRAVDYHKKLLAEADLVITSSTVLFERLKPARSDIVLVPNGVDLAHFSRMDDSARRNSMPIIGFHGAIAAWFDVELLYQVAKIRPGYQFELVGPASIDIENLTSLKNVHYRGVVAYEKIPEKIAQFDIGILPFTLSGMTHAVRPLKVLEYLAMGKPVVAAPLQEIQA